MPNDSLHRAKRGLLLWVLAAACRGDTRTAGRVPGVAARAAHSPVDSSVVVVTSPTLISSIVVTQAAIDSGGDAAEVLGDYQNYLSLAVPVLEKHGVQVHLTSDSTVRWRDSLGV